MNLLTQAFSQRKKDYCLSVINKTGVHYNVKNPHIHSRLKYILTVILLPLALVTCKQETIPDSGKLTFLSGRVTVNGKEAQLLGAVMPGDTVQTGKNSLAVIQFGETALVALRSDTVVAIADINPGAKSGRIHLNQKAGHTFSRILKSGVRYEIQTPTITAAVRGTSFSLRLGSDPKKSSLSVLKGSVLLIKSGYESDHKKTPEPAPDFRDMPVGIESPQAVIMQIQSGFRVDIDNITASKPARLDPEEKTEMELLERIELAGAWALPDTEKGNDKIAPDEGMAVNGDLPPGSMDAKRLHHRPIISMETLEELLSLEKKSPHGRRASLTPGEAYMEKLNMIKIKNRGKLDRIKLSSGKEITGMIIERGLVYKIETPHGIVIVDRSEIVSQIITH